MARVWSAKYYYANYVDGIFNRLEAVELQLGNVPMYGMPAWLGNSWLGAAFLMNGG
jgi:hypothetical protein